MKYESWHSRRAVFGGSRGRIRSMRASSIAADDMCACPLSDWMACACGVRVRATVAVLYCAAVGCMNSCWNCCSVVLGCSAWRCLFFDVVCYFLLLLGSCCCAVTLAFVHDVLLLLYLVRFGGAPFFPLLESPKRLMPVVFPFGCLSMFGVVDID